MDDPTSRRNVKKHQNNICMLETKKAIRAGATSVADRTAATLDTNASGQPMKIKLGPSS